MKWKAIKSGLLAGITGVTIAGCGPTAPSPHVSAIPEIVVDGLDYSFAMEESAQPGAARIRFTNGGEVDHELVLVRLQPGATMSDFSDAMMSDSDPRALVDGVVGILIADAGETSLGTLNVEFEPGRTYLMLCNFTDSPDAPPHLALGMIRAFTVPDAVTG